MRIGLLLLAVWFGISVRGEEILVPGSESPDHRLVVYAVDPLAQGAVGHLEVREKSSGKVVFDLGASGWVVTATALALPINTTVCWTTDGHLFALKLRTDKTDSEVVVYRLAGGKVEPVDLPDISEAIHKQVKFDQGRFYFESIEQWLNPHTLEIEVTGNTIDAIDEDGSYSFEYKVTVDVSSKKIIKIETIKKARVPSPSHAGGSGSGK